MTNSNKLKNTKIDILADFTDEEVAAITPTGFTKEEIICHMYKSGVPVTTIMKKHKISSGRFYEILNRHHVPYGKRKSSKAARRLAQMSAEEKQKLVYEYANTEAPMDYLYKKYGINKYGLYSILDEQNVPRRNKTGLHSENRPIHNNANRKRNPEDDTTKLIEAVAAVPQPLVFEVEPTRVTISEVESYPVDKIDFRLEDGKLFVDVLVRQGADVSQVYVNINLGEEK
jgi:hypothetical protein